MTAPGTEIAQVDEIALAEQARRERRPIPSNNGLLAPARWEMFGRIANTVSGTEFVPKGLRGNAPAVMACLLYGDAMGLHPSVALTEVHIVDGKPTMSATLMVGMIRQAGHRLSRKEIRTEEGHFFGSTAVGVRGDDGETDEFTFTLEMAARAGLMSKHNWKAYPEAMCHARAVAQLARMLFPDVFLGQSAYTSEELGVEQTDESGAVTAEIAAITGGTSAPGEEPQAQVEAAADPAPEAAPAEDNPPVEVETPAAEPVADEPIEDAEVVPATDAREEGDRLAETAATFNTWTPLDADPPDASQYEGAKHVVANKDSHDPNLVELATVLIEAYEETLAGDPTPEQVGPLPIPKVMEAVAAAKARGDHDFIAGVVAYEFTKPEGRRRQRLIDTLVASVAEMRRVPTREVLELYTGVPAVEREPEHPEPVEREDEPVVEQPAFAPTAEPTDHELDETGDNWPALAGDVPFETLEQGPATERLLAAIAYSESKHPDRKEWIYPAVVKSAAATWNPEAASLGDFSLEQVSMIWNALPADVREPLAVMDGNTIRLLASTAGKA